MPRLSLTLVAIGTLAASAHSQITFEPNLGSPVTPPAPNANEFVVSGLALGFSFTFPDGTFATSIDVTGNGRVFASGTGGSSNFNTTVANFLADPSAIYPFWRNLSFDDPRAGDLFFNALPGKAVITWSDVIESAPSAQMPPAFTFQCQLFADGRVHFIYDLRAAVTLGDCIVGLSAGGGGGGTPDPGAVDFAVTPRAPFTTAGNATVYEFFTAISFPSPAIPFDLQGFGLEFAPDGVGGWNVGGVAGPVARATEFGLPCQKAIEFMPRPGGGYVVVPSFAAFDLNLGIDLQLGDEDVSGPLALGFPFAFPGGTTTPLIEVTSNGRILNAGSATMTIFNPAPFWLFNRPFPTIAPFWADYDPSSGGAVRFNTGPGFATVTWDEVVQRGQTEPITFQATLRSDSSITFIYRSTHRFVEQPNTVMIGVAAGSGATAGESDFNALPVVGGSTIYEWIDTTFGGGESNTYQLGLAALTAPVLGTSFDLQLDGIQSASTTAAVLVGFSNPNIDLGAGPGFGLTGCSLYVQPIAPGIVAPIQGPNSAVVSLLLSMDPALLNLTLFFQGVTVTPGANPLGIVLSNGVRGEIGL